MRNSSYYTNHLGIKVEFNTPNSPYTCNPIALRSFSTTAAVLSNKITAFTNEEIKSYNIELGIKGKNREETADNYDYLISIFETDTLASEPGMLTVNGYSLKCYINGFDIITSLNCAKIVAATVTSDTNCWYKELFTMLFTSDFSIVLDSEPITYQIKEYPHGYPLGYPTELAVKEINNPALRPTHFRLIFEGPVYSPTVIIGGHTYAVNTNVEKGESLIIDSRAKTITRIVNGEKINEFSKRNRESYVFEKIPLGINRVSYSNDIQKFFITLIDERSYPKWKI
ncbi:MAG: hypothetical protein IJA02_08940 [Clostridia bacterium]|nr:hypothetical protein [Clostridia bacterium]